MYVDLYTGRHTHTPTDKHVHKHVCALNPSTPANTHHAHTHKFMASNTHMHTHILRVPYQNGVSLLYNMLEIRHSGQEPSICSHTYVRTCAQLTHTHAYTCVQLHTQTQTHMHMHACTHTREHTHTRTLVCTHADL